MPPFTSKMWWFPRSLPTHSYGGVWVSRTTFLKQVYVENFSTSRTQYQHLNISSFLLHLIIKQSLCCEEVSWQVVRQCRCPFWTAMRAAHFGTLMLMLILKTRCYCLAHWLDTHACEPIVSSWSKIMLKKIKGPDSGLSFWTNGLSKMILVGSM